MRDSTVSSRPVSATPRWASARMTWSPRAMPRSSRNARNGSSSEKRSGSRVAATRTRKPSAWAVRIPATARCPGAGPSVAVVQLGGGGVEADLQDEPVAVHPAAASPAGGHGRASRWSAGWSGRAVPCMRRRGRRGRGAGTVSPPVRISSPTPASTASPASFGAPGRPPARDAAPVARTGHSSSRTRGCSRSWCRSTTGCRGSGRDRQARPTGPGLGPAAHGGHFGRRPRPGSLPAARAPGRDQRDVLLDADHVERNGGGLPRGAATPVRSTRSSTSSGAHHRGGDPLLLHGVEQ